MSDPQNQSEDTTTPQDPQEPQQTDQTPWTSVASDFQSLGKSIADAIKNTFQDDKYKEQLTELRTGLQNMTEQVASAVDETIKSSNVKSEVKKAAGEVKEVGGKVYSDTKPFLTGALKTLNEGIQSIINRLETPQENNEE
jgi:uncharacterized protein YjbJ (UPF0337 family)